MDKKAQERFVEQTDKARLVTMDGTKHEIYMSDDNTIQLYIGEILEFLG